MKNDSTKIRYYICVTPFFPSPTRWQGAYVLDQVKAIQRNSEYKVLVFKTNVWSCKEDDYDIEGIHVHTIRPLLMPSYILNGITENIVGQMFVYKLKALGIDLNQIAFIHCHTTNHSAFGYGIKKVNPKAKVIIQFHDLDPLTIRNGKWANIYWNRRYRARKSIMAINKADLLVCISEPVRRVIEYFPKPRPEEVYEPAIKMYEQLKDMPTLKPKNIYVLNNGVDISIFKKQQYSNSKNDNIYRIGCVANFQELKDHKTLVEAFNILIKKGYKNMRLSMLGSGETKEYIKNLTKQYNIYDFIEWHKEISHEKLPDYYNTLNLFVLPSYFEGFGCVYTEAYACGVPFICCEHQGAAECISPEEKDLWLIRPKDSEELANLIERQYKEKNVQHLIKDYNINNLIKNFLSYLEGI